MIEIIGKILIFIILIVINIFVFLCDETRSLILFFVFGIICFSIGYLIWFL